LTEITRPPVIRLSGQSPSHEVKHFTFGNRRTKSGPSSPNKTSAALTCNRGTCVNSTPVMGLRISVRQIETGPPDSRCELTIFSMLY
jgi:hypothetical protein